MMTKQKIGVGIIGASHSNPYSWAVNTHIPSIKAYYRIITNSSC